VPRRTFSLQYQRSASLEDNMGFLADMFLNLCRRDISSCTRRGCFLLRNVLIKHKGVCVLTRQPLSLNLVWGSMPC